MSENKKVKNTNSCIRFSLLTIRVGSVSDEPPKKVFEIYDTIIIEPKANHISPIYIYNNNNSSDCC